MFEMVVGTLEVLIERCILKFNFGNQYMRVLSPGAIFLKLRYASTLCESDSVGGVAQTWIIGTKTIGSSITEPSIPLKMGGTLYLIAPRLGE